MTRPLSRAELKALEPRYTIAGLFESGQFGGDEETALEEIRNIRGAFNVMVNPGRGWMTPRYSSGPPGTPRVLGRADVWRRYTAWRARHARVAAAPSAGRPWGLTVADLAVMAICEPVTLNDLADLTGMSAVSATHLFIAAVKDYGAEMRSDNRRLLNAYKPWRPRRRRPDTPAVEKDRAAIRARVNAHRERKRVLKLKTPNVTATQNENP